MLGGVWGIESGREMMRGSGRTSRERVSEEERGASRPGLSLKDRGLPPFEMKETMLDAGDLVVVYHRFIVYWTLSLPRWASVSEYEGEVELRGGREEEEAHVNSTSRLHPSSWIRHSNHSPHYGDGE